MGPFFNDKQDKVSRSNWKQQQQSKLVSWCNSLCFGGMDGIVAVCHFCEQHGPSVVFCTQTHLPVLGNQVNWNKKPKRLLPAWQIGRQTVPALNSDNCGLLHFILSFTATKIILAIYRIQRFRILEQIIMRSAVIESWLKSSQITYFTNYAWPFSNYLIIFFL